MVSVNMKSGILKIVFLAISQNITLKETVY